MPKKVHKLSVTKAPFTLVAISCSENRHKLAWLLNSTLGLTLRDSHPIISNDSLEFPTQHDEESNPEMGYLLIKSKHQGMTLFAELANIDYLLKLEGVLTQAMLRDVVKQVKSIEGVVAAIPLDPSKLKRVYAVLST